MTLKPTPRLNIKAAVCSSHEIFMRTVFQNTRLSAVEKKIALSFLTDPVWRPLCELKVNGLTSYEGALILMGAKLVVNDVFFVRKADYTGLSVVTCDLSREGNDQFDRYFGIHTGEKRANFTFEIFASFQEYAAIDTGAGLVASRSALESAIEFDDWEILKRLRDLPTGHYSFKGQQCENPLPPEFRADYMEFYSSWENMRTGSQVIDLAATSVD